MNYPIIQKANSPAEATMFSISTGCKNKKTGASELVAFSHVFGLGLDCIREDVSVTINGHRYEPDLAYIDAANGVYVDIEIDEPYSGRHHPTHYISENGEHKDQRRNDIFRNAGWYVVRFTEQQMFCQTKSCMKSVFELLFQLRAIDSIPSKLKDAPPLNMESCWTAEESKKRSYQNYRKSYLGYDPIHMDFSSIIRCCVLIIPILFQSIWSPRVRHEMFRQLKGFFLGSLHNLL